MVASILDQIEASTGWEERIEDWGLRIGNWGLRIED